MTHSANAAQVFAGSEFERWARAEGLISAEQFLVEKYLRRGAETLEAGTGGGRILRALAEKGFDRLAGFDVIPTLIDEARKRDSSNRIKFSVQDARSLSYGDGNFDQLIYLQQVICFVGDSDGRKEAVAQAYRVLRPGGIAVFSFLSYEARSQSILYRVMLGYLSGLRFFSGRRTPLQYMPFLSRGQKFNWAAVLDQTPYVYWFRCTEASELLASQGFTVEGIGTLAQIKRGRLCASAHELERAPFEGMLYAVCRKPSGCP